MQVILVQNNKKSILHAHVAHSFFLKIISDPANSTMFDMEWNCSSRPRAEQHLVRWATSQLYDIDAIAKMVDPSIQGQCSEKALSRFADIISRCIQVKQTDLRSVIPFT